MKPRVFYIVNLDKRRISILVASFIFLTVSAFAGGFMVANNTSRQPTVRTYTPDTVNTERQKFTQTASDFWANRLYERSKDGLVVDRADPEEEQKSTEKPGKEEVVKTEKNEPKSLSSLSVANIKPVREEKREPVKPAKIEKKKPEKRKTTVKKKETPPPYKKEKSKPAVILDAAEVKKKKPEAEKPTKKVYTLQLGAFTGRSAATRMADQIRKTGLTPYVVQSGSYHVVRVGRASNRKELYSHEKLLKKENYSPITVEVGD